MNRHQRRALAKIQGQPLGQAAGQLHQAVQALQAVQGLETMPDQMAEAHRLMIEAHATVSALVEDCQGMSDEIEVLKAMLFQVVGPGSERAFEQRLAAIRAERTTQGSV